MHFARTLRAAGLPVGSGAVLDALRAVETVGLARRDDFYWTLHAVFVRRADQRPLFDEAFHVFWRNPQLLERVTSLLLPTVHTPPRGDARPLSRRLSEALFAGAEGEARAREPEEEIELDATLTWSDREVLRTRDFEQMSAAELAEAKAAIARLKLAVPPAPTRRYRPHPQGSLVDMRTTFRRSLRQGAGEVLLVRRRRLRKPAPIVVLCDISGSMSRYSRVLLHFAHALTRDRTRVSSFVFGTRLTNISRQLRGRDVDAAVERASEEVEDWSGGTRIGQCLDRFNREWSRRVCGQGAVVLFISDGLDRDAGEGVGPPGGASSQVVPAARVAEPPAPLRRLRAESGGDPRPPAPRGRVPAGAQPGEPGRPRRGTPRPAPVSAPGGCGVRRIPLPVVGLRHAFNRLSAIAPAIRSRGVGRRPGR